MDEHRKTPEQKFSGLELQIFPKGYYTWGFPVFFLVAPLKGGLTGLPKWEPRAMSRVYLVQPPFNTGLMSLVLNTRTGNVYPQHHVVFDNTFSTVDHTRKGTVPGDRENLVEDYPELATQENFDVTK